MLALLGAVFGFFQSMAPEGLKFLQDKRDKAHELAIMDKQISMQEKGIDSHLQEVHVQAQSVEATAVQKSYQQELKYSGKYSASVRPTVTYMAMGLYLFQKILLVCAVIFAPTLPWVEGASKLSDIAVVLWTAFDEMLLGWIVGFWFGSRSVKGTK